MPQHGLFSPLPVLLALVTRATATSPRPFTDAILLSQDALSTLTSNTTHQDLHKRSSDTCPSDYSSCSDLDAPSLCCADTQVCSADAAGYVACCPLSEVCTGTITGVLTTVPTTGSDATTVVVVTTTSSNGQVLASTTATTATTTETTSGSFIISGTIAVATSEAGTIVPGLMRVALGVLGVIGML